MKGKKEMATSAIYYLEKSLGQEESSQLQNCQTNPHGRLGCWELLKHSKGDKISNQTHWNVTEKPSFAQNSQICVPIDLINSLTHPTSMTHSFTFLSACSFSSIDCFSKSSSMKGSVAWWLGMLNSELEAPRANSMSSVKMLFWLLLNIPSAMFAELELIQVVFMIIVWFFLCRQSDRGLVGWHFPENEKDFIEEFSLKLEGQKGFYHIVLG